MPRRKRAKRGGGWMGYVFSFLLGSFLAMGVYIWLSQEKPAILPPSLPPPAPTPNVFSVDQIIRSELYEMGISKKDVLLQRSSVKSEGGVTWDQSFMKIQVPRSLS